MKYHQSFLLLLLLSLYGYDVPAQILSPQRSTNWSVAGYQGNIPVYTLEKNILDFAGSGNGVTPNDLALQNAISSLNGGNGTVFFPEGVFVFNQPVFLRSGLVLKGAGAGNTMLQFNLSGSGNLITIAGIASNDTGSITSTSFKNSTMLTTGQASLFAPGDYAKVYQNDSGLVNDSWALGSVGQLIHIGYIRNDTVHFSNPLRRNYALGDDPAIQKIIPAQGVGIECLRIKRLDATVGQTSNILFSYAANCWVKGVESDSCNFAHVQISGSTNIEVTNSFFHGAFGYGSGGQGYGISCEYTSGECLIENNVFKHLRHSMLVQSGANGNVFGYNYSTEPFKTDTVPADLSGDIVLHGNYPYLNLFEGNIVQNIVIDASHGINGPFNTIFRNRAELYGLLVSPGVGDSTNIIGNEITGTGFQQGNYFAQGTGLLQYANNRNGLIIPAGSANLIDRSYAYSSTPSFWNMPSVWPTIGISNVFNIRTIPSKERFANGDGIVFCLPLLPVTYRFTGNGNWTDFSNWLDNMVPPSPVTAGSEIIIDPLPAGKCVLNISYTLNPLATLTVLPGKVFEVLSNLTFIR